MANQMTYAEAVKRVLDLLDRSVDLVEGCDWEDPEDPDGEEEDDEDENTATPVYAIAGGKRVA